MNLQPRGHGDPLYAMASILEVMKRRLRASVLIFILLLVGSESTAAQVVVAQGSPSGTPIVVTASEHFFDDLRAWRTQRLDGRSTEYRIVDEDGNQILKAASDDAAAALIRTVNLGELSGARLRWRWRVLHSLADNDEERETDGDDFAARVMVLFGDDSLSSDTRAIAYAWAGREPIGATFANPHTASVATRILRSGDANARVWVEEDRDVFADYVDAFGELPGAIAGIAILVDTDNTGSNTMAWFDDIELIGTQAN